MVCITAPHPGPQDFKKVVAPDGKQKQTEEELLLRRKPWWYKIPNNYTGIPKKYFFKADLTGKSHRKDGSITAELNEYAWVAQLSNDERFFFSETWGDRIRIFFIHQWNSLQNLPSAKLHYSKRADMDKALKTNW